MKTVGKGVREIRVRIADGAYRLFYAVDADNVYVLHAFELSRPVSISMRYRDIP